MMHRYPGSRSFTSDYRHLFFGRDGEKQELFRLIVLNDLVVLFGESGSGKTSLLQAGVCPELEESQYKPVFIRLNNTAESPERQVCQQLKEGGYLPADLPEDRSLWEYFSRFWYVDLGEVFQLVVVFDQFEELFTLYTPEQRADFIAQLAAIVNRRPPAGLPAEVAAPPKAKFVFSLRSDFLYLLDELSADIPAILRCRFQLRPLDRDRAAAAIVKPASMPGAFASPPFGYSPDALDGILDALGRRGRSSLAGKPSPDAATADHASGEIAAFQLQMVCQHLEKEVIRRQTAPGFQITPAFYGHAEGIEQIIDEFYNGVLQQIAPEEQEAVQKLLARGLIRNGRRIMMEASIIQEEYKVSSAALELLQSERLLKRETRKGELYYEISHDTLVGPVLERFKEVEAREAEERVREAEARVEEERRRAEEAQRLQKQAEEEKKKAQKMMFLAIGMAFLACLGLLGAGWLYDESEKERERAELERNKALRSDSLAQVATKTALDSAAVARQQRQIADDKVLETLEANQNTAAALAKLEITADQAMSIVLPDIDRNIYRLEYDLTYPKCQMAIILGVRRGEAEKRVWEMAYFYTETDSAAAAIAFLNLLKPLDFKANTPNVQAKLRTYLAQTMPARYLDFLRARYFPQTVLVEGGSFLREEDGAKVQVNTFRIGQTEITYWQYNLFARAENHHIEPPYWEYAGDNPAVYINWFDAAFYLNWLSERHGRQKVYTLTNPQEGVYDVQIDATANGFRLPTEAEWEFAGRGGNKTKGYEYSGSNTLDEVGWYDDNSRTHPVGGKKANELGLYDMSGNVWEWCQDAYDPNRVIRGGAWDDNPEYCRVAFRYWYDSDDRLNSIGFRLVFVP